MQPRAIETCYKGHRFRSRLEARWAVFFDALGLAWEYEPEGFELPGGVRYLPDFRLTAGAVRVYVEIKPPVAMAKHERDRIALFARAVLDGADDGGLLVFQGDPFAANCFMFCKFGGEDKVGPLSFEEYANLWVNWSKKDAVGVAHAAAGARGARFEHGESGARA
jgi:hypothetical protein